MTPTPVFAQAVKSVVTQFANSDGTTPKAIVAAGANGSRIESLIVSSTDTSARDVNLYVYTGSTAYLLTTVSIPATSGYVDSVPTVDLLRSTQLLGLANDERGNYYIYLAAGYSLYLGLPVALTSGKNLNVFAQGGDY